MSKTRGGWDASLLGVSFHYILPILWWGRYKLLVVLFASTCTRSYTIYVRINKYINYIDFGKKKKTFSRSRKGSFPVIHKRKKIVPFIFRPFCRKIFSHVRNIYDIYRSFGARRVIITGKDRNGSRLRPLYITYISNSYTAFIIRTRLLVYAGRPTVVFHEKTYTWSRHPSSAPTPFFLNTKSYILINFLYSKFLCIKTRYRL